MTSTRRSRLRGLRNRLSGDGGFALVEVMVSAVLLIVLATATLNIIDKSGNASANTRQRSVATGLAQEDQDSMRVMSIARLDRRDTTYTRTVANTNYSIRSVAQWVRDGGAVRCDSNTSRVEYLKTTSYVTWPGHESNPVILESYISPGVEALAKGSLMVKLHTDPGVGVPNQQVVLSSGQTGMTDQDGCVLFTGLAAGTLNVKWDGTTGDYVDRNGVQTPNEDVTIGAGQTAQVDRLWDKAGHALVRWVDENSQPVIPTTMSSPNGGPGAGVTNSLITKPSNQVRLFDNRTASVPPNTPLDPPIAPVTVAGTTTKVNELFPYTQAYSIFAGGCASNQPPSMATVPIPAGADSAQTDVKLSTVSVVLSGSPWGGGSVTKVKLINTDSDPNCLDTAPVAAVSPSTTVFHVPYGRYTICVQKDNGGSYASTAVGAYETVTPQTIAKSYPVDVSKNTQIGWSGTRGSTC